MHVITVLLRSIITLLLFGTLSDALDIALVWSGSTQSLANAALIVKAAEERGHRTLVFVGLDGIDNCNDLLSSMCCVLVRYDWRIRTTDGSTVLTDLLYTALGDHWDSPGILLSDIHLKDVDAVAERYSIPMVIFDSNVGGMLWEGSGGAPSIPHFTDVGSAVVNRICGGLRWLFLSYTRQKKMVDEAFLRTNRHVIIEGVVGLSVVGPLCPNVHPIGYLGAHEPRGEMLPHGNEDAWLKACDFRFFYADISVTSSNEGDEVYKAMEDISVNTNTCLLWYCNSGSTVAIPHRNQIPWVKVSFDKSAAPSSLLYHYKPAVVITKDPKSILYESMLAESAIIAIDTDEEVCLRIQFVNIGVCVPSIFSVEKVFGNAKQAFNSSLMRENMRRVKRMGHIMGGAPKAIKIIELVALLGRENADFFCDPSLGTSPYEFSLDLVFIASCFIVFLVMLFHSLAIRS